MATNSKELQTIATDDQWAVMEKVVIQGDLSKLSEKDRIAYYRTTCQSLGLNPTTRPFEYITLNGKLTLYARKDATEQLRNIRNVSVQIVARERHDDLYVVTARATMPNGRTDESIGAVALSNLKGEALANALMKAETKAKRRVTLSVCGLGLLDETETETIPGAQVMPPEAISEPVVRARDRDEYLMEIGTARDPEMLVSAWEEAVQAGYSDDPEFFGEAYDLIKGLYQQAETAAEWNAVKAAQVAIGYGDDDELKAIAVERQKAIKSAQTARGEATEQQTINV